jgi:hypothetical protein
MVTWFDPATLDCGEVLPEDVDDAAAYATEVLYHLTGRRWPGIVTDSITLDCRWTVPCVCDRATARNAWGSGCACGCGLGQRLQLPGFPVVAVTSVTVASVALAPAAWRVDDRRYLVRLDGQGWPCDGTAQVVYTWGSVPPAAGIAMAERFACEAGKAMNPGCKSCRLPRRPVSVSRQGVSVQLPGTQELIATGQTGLPEVDLWVNAVLLGDKRRRAVLLDPSAWPNRHRRP